MEKISVIIPAYNTGKFLPQAIDSIQEQTHKPHEIIVVDDGSDDNTETVVKNTPGNIHYHFQENKGIASARNKGLELAIGDLITFIDADDIWCSQKLEMQVELLRKHPNTDLVIGFLQRVGKSNDGSLVKVFEGDESGIFVMQLGSTLIRRDLFKKIGNFDEDMTMSEDLDWFLRVREHGVNVHVHNDVVQLYRQHDNNTTNDKITTKRYMLKAFKKSLDRRRGLDNDNFNIPSHSNNMDEMLSFFGVQKSNIK